MSFMDGSFVGVSFVLSADPIFAEIPYDKLEIFGEAVFDKLWVRNMDEKDANMDLINNFSEYSPSFDSNTSFLAEFNDNLSAGNISSSGEPVKSWLVNKRKIGTRINSFVGEYDKDVTAINDFRVKNGESYIYQITPKTETKLGQPLLSEEVVFDTYGIFLIDEETGMSINFEIEGDIGSMSAEDDKTSYNTMNQFNTIAFGDKNVLKGTISGIVNKESTYCNGIIQSSDFIDLIQDFVNNKTKKLLKTRKGDIYEIVTNNFSRTQFEKRIREQLDVVSFDFEQISRVKI
jgi:hypothetical protein